MTSCRAITKEEKWRSNFDLTDTYTLCTPDFKVKREKGEREGGREGGGEAIMEGVKRSIGTLTRVLSS